jgi:hypothetical protein
VSQAKTRIGLATIADMEGVKNRNEIGRLIGAVWVMMEERTKGKGIEIVQVVKHP